MLLVSYGLFWGEVSVQTFKFIKFKLLFGHSVMSDSLWPHGLHTRLAWPSFTTSQSLLKFISTDFAIQPSHPLPPIPPALSLSQHQGISSLHQVAKDWSFSISHSSKYSGLIFFKIDWSAVLGTFKYLLQHHNLKASILWRSVFFMVQISHPYMTTGKTIALTIGTFVSKLMSLLFIFFFNLSFHLFLLVGGELLYNIVVVFAIHWTDHGKK